MSTENLLLEIGTEEIPSGYFNHILDMLSCKKESPVRALFEAQNIRVDKVSSYSTPRRIILHCEDIPINQNIVIEGPPKRIAYGEDGTPTKALEAFVGKNNASLEDVEVRSSGTEERVILKKENVSNGEVLKDLLPKVIKSLDFPKSMRWDEKGVTFARPIRWILALFGKELLEFSIGDIQSCNVTHGHRFLGKDKIRVRDAGSYFRLLDRNHVVWDNERRKQKLLTFLQKKRWHENPALLDEVNNIVEFPFFLEGVFKEEYLKLPKEVLLASMAKHQRVFCLKDKQGNLTNRFVAVLNGNYKGRRNIRKHYEEVLDARLKDALFFYGADTKKDLSKIAAGLKDVIFHKELGTLKDKVERVKDIALFLTHYIKIDPDEKKYLGRAVSLCKADLLTQMVREFPSLQGTVGKYYAAVSGEDDSVCEAIGEHYLPRFGDDEIPQT
ncbi:MAG: glycine--tRNA ligase subunit beta, partial [Candidatus Omnitrophica bacterium]|nr:glycine--tRNA ligase subunit beta [Candidatus Omnitrophota bacterium]